LCLEFKQHPAKYSQAVLGSRNVVMCALSHLQMVKVGNAGLHQRPVHLDEIVLNAACLCRGKYSAPIQSALAYRHYLASLCRPTLNMHGNEAARVFGEVPGGIIAVADGGNLELELDELRIEKLKEQVIRPLAVDLCKLKVLVVEALHYPGGCCSLAHSVVFVGRPLQVIQSGMLRAVQTWNKHLSQADIFCPRDAVVLTLPQFVDREVAADAGEAFLVQDTSEFRSFEFAEAGEPGVGISDGRAQLYRLESGCDNLLQRAAEVLGDPFSYRPCLTSNGQAKRIGVKYATASR
jgi:hypothetical protein